MGQRVEQVRTRSNKSYQVISSYHIISPDISKYFLRYPAVSSSIQPHEASRGSCIFMHNAEICPASFAIIFSGLEIGGGAAATCRGTRWIGRARKGVKDGEGCMFETFGLHMHMPAPHITSHIIPHHPNSSKFTQYHPILAGLPVTILMTDSTYSSFSAATFHL